MGAPPAPWLPTRRAVAPEEVDTVAIGVAYLDRLLAAWSVERVRVAAASVLEAELHEALAAGSARSAAAPR